MGITAQQIQAAAKKLADEMIKNRRMIHQHPELAFQEKWTSDFVKKQLDNLSISYQDNIAETGVCALIQGKKGPGRTVLLRADMDALPLEECSGVAYASQQPGKMHACGHDLHTAILLGAAKIIKSMEDQFSGNVKLMFQPAEEGAGGAEPMIQAGILTDPPVDAALGLHVETEFDCGTIAVKSGALMASPDEFDITITGRGGHAAYPHTAVDPVLVAAKVIEGLQSIISRCLAPSVPAAVTVCMINGGSSYNIIPDTVRLGGTARAVDFETREKLFKLIEQITRGICAAMGATCEFAFRYMYPPLINDADMIALVCRSARELIGDSGIVQLDSPFMGGEDFAYVAKEVPAAFFHLGCRNEQKGCVYPLHSPKFRADEDCMPLGAAILAHAALSYLNADM